MVKPTSNQVFVAYGCVVLSLGAVLGYRLSAYAGLVPLKLLNIIGIMYGIFGVIILSEVIIQTQRVKQLIVYWFAGGLLWAHLFLPIGVILGAAIGFQNPAAGRVATFFGTFLFSSMLVGALVDATVFNPVHQRFRELEGRTQRFGITLVLSGMTLQLLAAFKDF